MALTRVQATGRVTASSSTTVNLTFSTLPIIGNAIIVAAASYHAASPGPTGTCTDNQGNTYSVVGSGFSAALHATIFACYSVTTSSGTFTATVTRPLASYFEACAIEVGGFTSFSLDKTTNTNTPITLTPSTGSTAALTGSDVFIASIVAVGANETSIVVESVSPSWTQELENLSYSSTIAAEVDSRIRSGVSGTTQSCSWTLSPTTANCVAVIVVFNAVVPAVSVETTRFFIFMG